MHSPLFVLRPGASRIFAYVYTDGSISQTTTPKF